MTTYLRHGCVPVVVQDGVDMPFERVGAFRGSVDGGGDGSKGAAGGAGASAAGSGDMVVCSDDNAHEELDERLDRIMHVRL